MASKKDGYIEHLDNRFREIRGQLSLSATYFSYTATLSLIEGEYYDYLFRELSGFFFGKDDYVDLQEYVNRFNYFDSAIENYFIDYIKDFYNRIFHSGLTLDDIFTSSVIYQRCLFKRLVIVLARSVLNSHFIDLKSDDNDLETICERFLSPYLPIYILQRDDKIIKVELNETIKPKVLQFYIKAANGIKKAFTEALETLDHFFHPTSPGTTANYQEMRRQRAEIRLNGIYDELEKCLLINGAKIAGVYEAEQHVNGIDGDIVEVMASDWIDIIYDFFEPLMRAVSYQDDDDYGYL